MPNARAVAPLWNDPDPEPNQMLDTGALAGDGGFNRRVESVIRDGQRRPRLTICFGSQPVLAGQSLNVLFGRTRAAPRRVSGEYIQVNEPAGRRGFLRVRMYTLAG